MKHFTILLRTSVYFIFASSCRVHPGADSLNGDFKGQKYSLRLNAPPAKTFYFEITDKTTMNFEYESKKSTTINKTDAGVYYTILKGDSDSTFTVSIKYDKIHIYTKSGDREADLDSKDGANSIDPTEKILGIVTNSNLSVTVNNLGEIQHMDGYKEMSDKILANYAPNDFAAKNQLQKKLQELVERSLVRKNISALFKMFPDSTVRIGDKWKLLSRENEGLNVDTRSTYTLEDIDGGIANISMSSEIKSDSIISKMMDYDVTANLSGTSEGEFSLELKTGLLSKSKIIANIEGTIIMEGREIPISIETSQKMTKKIVN